MPDSIRRFVNYMSRHGVRATVRRLGVSWQRFRSGARFAIYGCNLQECGPMPDEPPNGGKVERKTALAALAPDELNLLAANWAPAIARQRIEERFLRGASLWQFKMDGKFAGYGWTLAGGTIEPHFFPLDAEDVHLFDFFVFPEFRGRRINPSLVNHILARMALEKKCRAFIEAAEWNAPQLSSLVRTPFRRLGMASKRRLFGRTLVAWSDAPAVKAAAENGR